MDKVSYELVAPYVSLEIGCYDGALLRIEGSGYTTDDPRIISELDVQAAVQRVAAQAPGAAHIKSR